MLLTSVLEVADAVTAPALIEVVVVVATRADEAIRASMPRHSASWAHP